MCECGHIPHDPRCPDNGEEPAYICEICGAEIFSGESYYDISEMIICPDCVEDMRETA